MERLKKYPKYKPSGVDWIGEIPEHWEVIKLKYALETLESGSRESGGGSIGEGIFSIGGEHIGWFGELLLENPKYISSEYFHNLKKGKIKTNDVLLVKDGATIGKCAIIKILPFEKCAVNEHVFILRANVKYDASYLFYYIWCRTGQEQILLNVKGSAQPGLNSQFINDFFIPLPPLPEQTAIANFLDEKTAAIDSLIEKKKKLIELYKEEKTALINQAVTRGINPNVKLKPSGVDWLGDIPEHWEVKKLKYVAKVHNGSTPNSGEKKFWDGEIIWLTPQDLSKQNILFIEDSNRKITFEGLQEIGGKLVPINTIIMSTRAPIGSIGIAKVSLTFNQGCKGIEITSENSTPLYFYYLFLINIGEFQSLGKGTTFTELSSQSLKDFLVCIPLPEEQQQIVEYIESETKRIDDKIARAEKEIELLQEYRTALISEVVTGKIKV